MGLVVVLAVCQSKVLDRHLGFNRSCDRTTNFIKIFYGSFNEITWLKTKLVRRT